MTLAPSGETLADELGGAQAARDFAHLARPADVATAGGGERVLILPGGHGLDAR